MHNHTSAWEPYIFHYTAGIPTPTLFLFVVNFHEPRYAPVRFLSTQYFPLFRRHFLFDFDVVFLGPWENRGDRVLSHHLPIHGHFSYRSLAIAYEQLCVREACRYASFVLMNDDSYLDPRPSTPRCANSLPSRAGASANGGNRRTGGGDSRISS